MSWWQQNRGVIGIVAVVFIVMSFAVPVMFWLFDEDKPPEVGTCFDAERQVMECDGTEAYRAKSERDFPADAKRPVRVTDLFGPGAGCTGGVLLPDQKAWDAGERTALCVVKVRE